MQECTMYSTLSNRPAYPTWNTSANALAIRHGETTLVANGDAALAFSIGFGLGVLALAAALNR